MPTTEISIRRATPGDAELIAVLANQAGEGMPLLVWQGLSEPGSDPWAIGRARAAGEEAGISWRNAWIAEVDAEPAGLLIAYRQPDAAEPVDPEMPAMFVPLQELENEAPGTGYVYMLSTMPALQGRGVGGRLLDFAERYAGPKGMSLIVSDANGGARRLYERHGYRVAARRTMVKEGWDNPGREWLLMVKPEAAPAPSG